MLLAADLRFDDEEPFCELDAFLVEDEAFAFAVVLADFAFDCAGFAFDEVDLPAFDFDEADFAAGLFLADDLAEAFVDFPADDLAEVFDDPNFDFDAPAFGLEDFLAVGISFSSRFRFQSSNRTVAVLQTTYHPKHRHFGSLEDGTRFKTVREDLIQSMLIRSALSAPVKADSKPMI